MKKRTGRWEAGGLLRKMGHMKDLRRARDYAGLAAEYDALDRAIPKAEPGSKLRVYLEWYAERWEVEAERVRG